MQGELWGGGGTWTWERFYRERQFLSQGCWGLATSYKDLVELRCCYANG